MNPTMPSPANAAESVPTSRREFLSQTSRVVAASALAGVALPHVHAAEDNTIRLGIVGSGNRGSGAVVNAMYDAEGPIKLVAMADVVEAKLKNSYKNLRDKLGEKVDVTADRQFLGFDGYKKVMDCLRPGDVVLLTTHAAFRATHLEYAIRKGLNVFMEKSFAPDPGGIKRILQLAEEADRKNLKIGCGLMCRHSASRQALIAKIREGELGDIHLMRAYRMQRGGQMPAHKPDENELLWQIQHPGYFFWASSGWFIDNVIHQIDECCWIKDGWPVSALGLGGRSPANKDGSQNYDTYAVEYTFADGAKAFVDGRFVPNTFFDFSTWVHGTKCAAQFSGNVHAPTVQLYKDQRIANANIAWKPEKEACSPYDAEWKELLSAVRNNRKYNEAHRAARSNLAAIMGRAAVHTGNLVTWEQAEASDFKFCPNPDALTLGSPAPVQADAQGQYPVPVPGAWKEI